MYIFKIVEIEQIIFGYLDCYTDFNVLKQIDKNYRDMIKDNENYKKLCGFRGLFNISINDKFIRACRTNLFTAKYFFYKYKSINIHHHREYAFQSSCFYGFLDIAQWLWQLDGKINLHIDDEYVFRWSCKCGQLDVVQWLWSLDGKINLHVENDYVFRNSCENGHLDVAKWLWSLDGKIKLHFNNDYAFRYSCKNDHLDVAKWLWSLDGKINLSVVGENYGSKITKWLTLKRSDLFD